MRLFSEISASLWKLSSQSICVQFHRTVFCLLAFFKMKPLFWLHLSNLLIPHLRTLRQNCVTKVYYFFLKCGCKDGISKLLIYLYHFKQRK
eukprot:UN08072